MASKSLTKPNQKLIYSKDSNINLSSSNGNDSSIMGLFKSSSSLARSIRQEKFQSNSLKSSGAMIINPNQSLMDSGNSQQGTKASSFKTPPASVQKDIQVRNIIHNYSNIDCNQNTYQILNTIKSDKRMRNLDTLDDYEVWKGNYFISTEDGAKERVAQLKQHLNDTQNEINSKFTMKDEALISLIQTDINEIARFYHGIIQSRDNNIEETFKQIIEMFSQCEVEISLHIQMLAKQLDDIGFLLEEEISDLTNEKQTYLTNTISNKKSLYTRVINEVRLNEKNIVDESAQGLIDFIVRWKNVKLNNYIAELKGLLNSEEYIDNIERYALIDNLRKDQENIYNKRKALIFDRLLKLNYDKINTKNIEKFNKELEDIYSTGEKLFTQHVELLVANSELIQRKTMNSIEEFKSDVGTIAYEFGKNNHNEQKYNSYDDVNDLDGLIDLEINPIVSNNKLNRTDYISRINAYIDEYEDYINNTAAKMISLFALVGKLYDDQKKNLMIEEKKYLISIAKATDTDEENINEKEEHLKKIISEMRACINKIELDGGLEESFKVMDELEIEYRAFFKDVEELLNGHEGLLTENFHKYEEKILLLFGIYNQTFMEAIANRRNKESSFLSKRKEAAIAIEEEKKYEEEMKNQLQSQNAKKKPPPKKQDKKVPLKKGEVPLALVPPREISSFKSVLGFDYLTDFTIEEYVRHFLRNIVNNREDDIFELKPKPEPTPEEIQKRAEAQLLQQQEDSKKPEVKGDKGKKVSTPVPSTPNETNLDFFNAFDPYNANSVKSLISPLSLNNDKLLSEDNYFLEENLILGLNELYQTITNALTINHQAKVKEAQLHDNEKREEFLSELDIRLKSLAPRKGKIEVEEYDKRLSELEKHDQKLNQHRENITKRNEKDNEDNNALLDKLASNFSELQSEYEKLSKGIEEEETNKGLEDKYKKFKTTFYDFITDLTEIEKKLQKYSKSNPDTLLNLNKNYMLSLAPIAKGGTYSDREIEFTQGILKELEDSSIIKDKEERTKKNSDKVTELKKNSEGFMNEIEKKYALANENIMAKEAIGKKFGAPKRLANDIIINIKIKCNQAQESLTDLFKQLTDIIQKFSSITDKAALNEALSKNILPISVRKQLSKINTCIFYYGKYIDAFKPNITSGYSLSRVLMKENSESCEIIAKEDIDEDERLKNEEIKCLGFLGKIILEGNPQQQQQQQQQKGKAAGSSGNANEPNYNCDVSSIDDKVKTESAKIYIGPFAKFITTNDKLPQSLVPFLQNIKSEMELMRLKCVRDLRTYCQNLYKFSLEIPKCIMKFIYAYSCQSNQTTSSNLNNIYRTELTKSKKITEDLKAIIGPYLANPYFKKDLEEIEVKESERSTSYLKCLNQTQYNLIENEEKNSSHFTIRLLNNFESLLILFDGFIFEEEFISLGDEEYFKQRQSYNELLKLKSGINDMANNPLNPGKNVKPQSLDASGYNLDAKRTFKKVYKGINKSQGKINYYNRFKESIVSYVQNSEEKIKMLEAEYGKENYTKNITGIKLQNNKNLFLERNEYFKMHSEDFNKHIDNHIKFFTDSRYEEMEYVNRWNEMLKRLKATLEGNIHD